MNVLRLFFLMFCLVVRSETLEWSYQGQTTTNVVIELYSSVNIRVPMTNWIKFLVLTNPANNFITLDAKGQKFFVGYSTFYDFNKHVPTNVAFAWDESPSTGVNSYMIYYGPISQKYTNALLFPRTNAATVSNIAALNFFTITAKDIWGNESSFATNEVAYESPVAFARTPLKLKIIKNIITTITPLILNRVSRTNVVLPPPLPK